MRRTQTTHQKVMVMEGQAKGHIHHIHEVLMIIAVKHMQKQMTKLISSPSLHLVVSMADLQDLVTDW